MKCPGSLPSAGKRYTIVTAATGRDSVRNRWYSIASIVSVTLRRCDKSLRYAAPKVCWIAARRSHARCRLRVRAACPPRMHAIDAASANSASRNSCSGNDLPRCGSGSRRDARSAPRCRRRRRTGCSRQTDRHHALRVRLEDVVGLEEGFEAGLPVRRQHLAPSRDEFLRQSQFREVLGITPRCSASDAASRSKLMNTKPPHSRPSAPAAERVSEICGKSSVTAVSERASSDQVKPWNGSEDFSTARRPAGFSWCRDAGSVG